MATIEYNAKTGRKLKKGETTTQDGKVVTQGQEYNLPNNIPGTNVPLRNDMQSNNGAGYAELGRLSNVGQSTPNNIIGTDTLQNTNTKLKLEPTPSPYYAQEPTLLEATTDAQREQARIIKEKETQGADISKLIADIGGVQGKEAQYATDEGADEAQKEYGGLS